MQEKTLITLSGPTASGKSTLAAMLKQHGFIEAVSTTTRGARKNETDGVDYYFVDKETFQQMIEQDAFIEYSQVGDNYYGLSKDAIKAAFEKSNLIISVLDPKGAKNIHDYCTKSGDIQCFKYYVNNPIETLKARLLSRHENDPNSNERVFNERLFHLTMVEPTEWTAKAMSGEDFYHTVFKEFTKENEQEILNHVLNQLNHPQHKKTRKPTL